MNKLFPISLLFVACINSPDKNKNEENLEELKCKYSYFMNGDKLDSILISCPDVKPPKPDTIIKD